MPADKAFDANWIVEELNQRGAKIVISQRPKRLTPIKIDLDMYKWRQLIENFLRKLNKFKRIAMRACKTDQSFQSLIYLCAAVINTRSISTGPRLNRHSAPEGERGEA